MAQIITQTCPSAIVTDSKYFPILQEALKISNYKETKQIIITDQKELSSNETNDLPSIYSWNSIMGKCNLTDVNSDHFSPIRNSENSTDCVTLIFSSGSTGAPKATMIDDGSLNSEFILGKEEDQKQKR